MGRTTKGKTHVGRAKILDQNAIFFFTKNELSRANKARAARDFIPLRAELPMKSEFLGERNFDLYARGIYRSNLRLQQETFHRKIPIF